MKESIINSCQKVNEEFQKNRSRFFSESDFHQLFYHNILTAEPGLSCLIHPEYPTLTKLKQDEKQGYKADSNDSKTTRGWYDFVILSEKFWNRHQSDVNIISCRNNKKNNQNLIILKNEIPYLDAAIEFKFILKKQKNTGLLILKDIAKLRLCCEAEEKFLFIFAVEEKDIDKIITDILADIKKYPEINLDKLYVFLNGKTIRDV